MVQCLASEDRTRCMKVGEIYGLFQIICLVCSQWILVTVATDCWRRVRSVIVEMSSSVLQQGNLSYTFHFFLKSTFVKYKNLAGRVVPLPQEGKTCSLAGFQNLPPSNMNKCFSKAKKTLCNWRPICWSR